MTYARVIPRDLFNEADLLKCLGRLSVVLGETPRHRAELAHVPCTGPFVVEQDPSDGSISCSNVALTVAGEAVHLFRGLNSRYAWPLWARFGSTDDPDDVEVFSPTGDLHDEFWARIRTPTDGRS